METFPPRPSIGRCHRFIKQNKTMNSLHTAPTRRDSLPHAGGYCGLFLYK